MNQKSLFILMGFLLLAVAVACAAGNVLSSTSDADGALISGKGYIEGACFWAGADGQTVTIYDGTGSSRIAICTLGGENSRKMFPVNLHGAYFYTSLYADVSWTGTGSGDPIIYIYLRYVR